MKYNMNLRRLRQNKTLRTLVSQVHVTPQNLIQPYFVYEGLKTAEPLSSIEGQFKHNTESLKKEIERGLNNGVSSAILFFIPQTKQTAHFKYDFDQAIITEIKKTFGDDLVLFADVCLCSQTDTGHCGLMNKHQQIDNHHSVLALAEKALSYAQAGIDGVAPSDMMDDRIMSIRKILDDAQLEQTLIMSYSSKFSSNFYGPFRTAAESTPQHGDRKGYQIDYRNPQDAILSSLRDSKQGADILMVKPAGAYLDILYQIKHHEEMQYFPLAAYQVSGEYQALWAMQKAGLISSFQDTYKETLVAIKRAGADMIITYGANNFKEWFYV